MGVRRQQAAYSSILENIGKYRIIDLETHGVFYEDNPLNSGFLIMEDNKTSRYLRARDIFLNVRMNAELLVAAMCNSGQVRHTQYQVILKPDPGNPQELYLESLKALGIDPRQHDIRFVEDNWEQPAISAWGLGWEVWLDGQEITQFTYFQQMRGVALDPVSVEITYGLERILIALNNAKAIWNEEYGAGITYGEIRSQEEFELIQ